MFLFMKINETNIKDRRKIVKNRGYVYKIACTRAVKQHRMLKMYQMHALTMYFDPKVWYKNNLIFNFMNLMKT